MIYFAHAIDRSKNTGKRVATVIGALRQFGYGGAIYVPSSAFNILPTTTGPDDVLSLVNTNMAALLNSDIMVIDYVPDIESWGMPQEVVFCKDNDIPMIMVIPPTMRYVDLSIYLRSNLREDQVVNSWKDAMPFIEAAHE